VAIVQSHANRLTVWAGKSGNSERAQGDGNLLAFGGGAAVVLLPASDATAVIEKSAVLLRCMSLKVAGVADPECRLFGPYWGGRADNISSM
jgi:hypothetical protein